MSTALVGKVDLVMWTKNGETFLPHVLKRIDEVIPQENIHDKILVDDNSTDRTVEIARDFNWNFYPNPKSGIPSGTNEALRHVECDYFVSVKQDILLAKDWWDKIPKYMRDKNVACAQGIRLPTNPSLRKLEEYANTKRDQFSLVSIDNNIFRTKMIKQLGGFPTICPTCTDTILMKKIVCETAYRWLIDETVISQHMREDLRYEIEHGYQLSLLCSSTSYCGWATTSLFTLLRLFLTSPFRGTIMAVKKRCPDLAWIYPFMRNISLKAFLHRK
jgi:glycosyltransferase involved in cell wall biosynthesis